MNVLVLVHNLPERGSYFRAHEIALRMARRGHHVQFGFVSNEKKYRPVYTALPVAEATTPPASDDLRNAPTMPKLTRTTSIRNFVWAEYPNYTLFNDRQEGWSVFDVETRISDALQYRWDLVYGFSHKPDCVLPALCAKIRGAKIALDWSDWWGGDEGLFKQCVIPSNAFQSMPRPLQLARRAVFATEDRLEPTAYRFADAVTLISEEFLRHPRAPRDLASKALVMHSGSPLDRIAPMQKHRARMDLRLNFPEQAIVLGYIANYHMDEALLMEAFAEICRRRADVHLLIAGADFERSTPAVHELTRDRIHHAGRQPFAKIGEYLGAADILLLPLTDKALNRARYPHKLSDYVAAGRPIVACDVGETGRIMRRFNFGSLSPPTAKDFAAAILSMVDQREYWNSIGSQIRSVAEEHFNWDTMCEPLFQHLSARTGLKI